MYFCFSIRDIVREELEPTLEGVDVDGCWSMWDMCAMLEYVSIITDLTIPVQKRDVKRNERESATIGVATAVGIDNKSID